MESEPVTKTSKSQNHVESRIKSFLDMFELSKQYMGDDKMAVLLKDKHIEYLLSGLRDLPSKFQSMDANRSWILFWCLHGLELLGHELDENLKYDIIQFVKRCQNPDGGFGGGPGHQSHLAPTYSFISSLAILNMDEAYAAINTTTLYNFLKKVKTEDGGFMMCYPGEKDTRALYCALSVASLTNILDDALAHKCLEYIANCQGFDGGIGGEPGNESHGGYTYCGVAALSILNSTGDVDMDRLLEWAVMRQMNVEGGFQGRENKLVDGCYSFWQGALFPLIDQIYLNKDAYSKGVSNFEDIRTDNWLFDQDALQKYLIVCCQEKTGGMRDKPGMPRDFYHTCYCLSGLSIAQHNPHYNTETPTEVFGNPDNLINETDPVYNIRASKVKRIQQYFLNLSK